MKSKLLSRRQFTRTMFAAAAAVGTAPAVLRGQNLNNKLDIAIIGAGGRGGSNLESVSSENIVALCDVNAANLDRASAKHAKARKIRKAAAKAKVATQMGIQIHATENYRQVVELVQSGVIGPVHEAHVWVSRAWGWQSEADAKRHKDIVWIVERPAESQPVPEGLDWKLWLGPAPSRPFNSVYFPGPKWY